MESIEIDKATKYLQEFDHYPEYQRKLDLLVKAYYAEIDIINSLMFHARTQKKTNEQTIKESPDIGTVRDNIKYGMQLAYDDVLKKLDHLEQLKEQEFEKMIRNK